MCESRTGDLGVQGEERLDVLSRGWVGSPWLLPEARAKSPMMCVCDNKALFFTFGAGVKDDDAIFKKPREIVHKNTRLDRDPFSKALNKSQIQQAAALNAQVSVLILLLSFVCWEQVLYWWTDFYWCMALPLQFKQGKVGPDGKELIPHESPTVNGYGYEAAPSPAPGMKLQCFFWQLSYLEHAFFSNCVHYVAVLS